jgi:hypothetical protein
MTLNEFEAKFSHIDLFYIALPREHVQFAQGLTLNPRDVLNGIIPRGGKHRRTKKHLNKHMHKTNTKSKRAKRAKHSKRAKRSKRRH